jgi:hypothetical protein
MQDLKHRFLYRPAFDENPYKMAFREGQRDLILFLLNMSREVESGRDGRTTE